MALLRRISQNVWTFLSPHKSNPNYPSSQATNDAQGPAVETIRKRPHSWDTTSTDETEADVVSKRKRRRLSESASELQPQDDASDFSSTHEDSTGLENSLLAETADLDDSLVVDGDEYEASVRKRIVNLPEEAIARGVSAEELRNGGWGEDHITLVQKLAMRGYEPLLPMHYHWDYSFLPDALFSDDDVAFISSVNGSHYHSIKALEKLFEIGGRARDSLRAKNGARPEAQIRRHLEAYIKWADQDSRLDVQSAIPILTVIAKPGTVPTAALQEEARQNFIKTAALYERAFAVRPSVEDSPTSPQPDAAYPIPQLYSIIASSTVVALVAYRPQSEQTVRPVIVFDLRDKNYDVWNAFALAIIINHCRNIQVGIAADTGLGAAGDAIEGASNKRPTSLSHGSNDDDDPDL